MSDLFREPLPKIGIRALHLDLKGLPPTFERLIDLLAVVRAARYNALVVEWEDMFPWTVDEGFRCETAYTPDDVRAFHEAAAREGLEVIPLVQCLGHMETPLRLERYRHLREVPDSASDLNPLAQGARELVAAMVEDVLRLSPGVRRLHLGGDESFLFGSHPDTRAYIEGHGKGALYLHHVEPLLDRLRARDIRPILWHDMMVEWDDAALQALADKADLCVWGYRGHPDAAEQHYNTRHAERFHACGIRLWYGTAYKCGADRSADVVEHVEAREENALGWMDVARRIPGQGVIATAWSRNHTNGTQYVPIDAALDSLVRVGVILHDGAPCQADRESLLAFLEAHGERERFEACWEACRRLTQTRRAGWAAVQEAHQQIACSTLDARRRESRGARGPVERLVPVLQKAEDAGEACRQAFQGLLPGLWIERYLGERLVPLREQCAMLQGRLSALRSC